MTRPNRDSRSKRGALLTKGQMDLLLKGGLKPQSKWKLLKSLNDRFSILLEELDLIISNPNLEGWRNAQVFLHDSRLYNLQTKLRELTGIETIVYLDRIMISKGKNGRKRFWIQKKFDPRYYKSIRHPSNLTKNLERKRYSKEIIDKLVCAYHYNLIPKEESNALSIETISAILEELLEDDKKWDPITEREVKIQQLRQLYGEGYAKAIAQYNEKFKEMLKDSDFDITFKELFAGH